MLEPVRKRLCALLPIAAIVWTFLLFHKIVTSVWAPYNWTRLARTFLLARGENPYAIDGPPAIAMYGPVSAWIFWPASLMPSPSLMMEAASLLNAAFFFVPVLIACFLVLKESRLYAAAAFFIFAFFPFMTSSLRDAAFNVHADAPALGFAALAGACLCSRSPKTPALAASAFFAVLAVWSKQVTLPVLLALPAYMAVREGRKAFFSYVFWILGFGTAFSAFFIWKFGGGNLWFQMVSIPAGQPFREEGGLAAFPFALQKIARDLFFVFLFAGFVLWKSPKDKRPWEVFIWIAASLLPAVFLGKMKVGGANNTISYVPYFLLLASVLALGILNVRGSFRKFTNWLLVFFIAAHGALIAAKFRALDGINPAQIAYDYAKEHPGEAYFPRLTLVHLLAEGKAYAESVALIDRRWAGRSVPSEEVRRFMPPQAKVVAFYEATGDDMHWMGLPEFSEKGLDPELPGFVVYRRDLGVESKEPEVARGSV